MQDTTQQKSALDLVNNSVSDLKSWTKSMLDYQNNTVQEHKATVFKKKDDSLKNMYASSLSANDSGVRQNCNNYFRLGLVAKGIRDYFSRPENGGIDYSNVDDDVLFDSYADSNPDRKNELYGFVLSDDEICDPTSLYENMGWIEPEVVGETEKDSSEGGNFILNSMKNYAQAFYEHGGQAVANVVNGMLDEIDQGTVFNPSDTDYRMSARENYATLVYGKNYYSLTPEQKAECDAILDTEEGMNMYKPSMQRVISRLAETGFDAYWMINAPIAQALISAGEEIPYIQDIIDLFGSGISFGGHIINKLPLLKQFRESLQTEQEKQERDQFVGTIGLMKLLQKRGGRVSKDNITDTIINEIDPETTISEFQRRFTELPSTAKNIGEKVAKKLPNQGEMIARINKLTQGEKAKFVQDYGGETYGDFLNRIGIVDGDEGAINKLHSYKSSLFDQITNALDEIGGEFDVNNPRMQEMIKDNLKNAKDVMERNPNTINKLADIAKKYFEKVKNPDGSIRINGKLNASEIKFLMRYFAEKTRLGFNKDNEPKKVQRHNNIYEQALDDLTRITEDNGYENMSEMSRDIQKSHFLINALGKDLAKKYGKSGLDAVDVLALVGDIGAGGWKIALKNILTSEWAKINYVKILNKFQGLTPEQQWANLDKIREINSKNMFDKWVEEIEKDSKKHKLGEDPKYSNNPVDYTSPTRVTPTGEAGRYGQTLETKKNTGLDKK